MSSNSQLAITLSKLKAMLGMANRVSTNSSMRENVDLKKSSNGRLTTIEIDNLLKMNDRHNALSNNASSKTNVVNNIMSYLQGTHKESLSISTMNAQLKKIHPEIEQAEDILTSSILSPNEMKSADIGFKIINTATAIDESLQKEVLIELSNFFNKHHKITDKFKQWIRDSLFGSGAKPVLILPKHALDVITGLNNDDNGVTLEAFNTSVVSGIKAKDTINKATVAMESEAAVMDLFQNESLEKKDDKTLNTFVKNLSDTLCAKISSPSFDKIVISDNSYVLAGSAKLKKLKDSLNKQSADFLKKQLTSIHSNLTDEYEEEELLMLKDEMGDEEETSHPIVIELPTESVIPVTVPGSKNEHVGYFILVDNYGNPISDFDTMYGTSGQTDSQQLNDTAFKSLFGDNNGLGNMGDIYSRRKYEIASTIFGIAIKNMIETKMDSMGLDGLNLGTYNSITNCMFYNVLREKKTRLVFVPESMITYFCFEYREDGTGKTRIEDIDFVLSLKTTFLISSVLAKFREAIDVKRISFDVPEGESDVVSLMETITQTYLAKNTYTFPTDPNDITRSIAQKSLILSAKSNDEIPQFNMEPVESVSRSSNKPDDTTLEELNKMYIAKLGVPYSVLNQLSENEFSRSVATSNIVYSNNIADLQTIWISKANKYVRTYVARSATLRKRIRSCILKYVNNNTNTENNEETVNIMFSDIINNISIALPEPNIASTKSHYEDFNAFNEAVSAVIDKIFDTDQLPVDDSELRDIFKTVGIQVRNKLLRDYIEQSNLNRTIDIPDLKDINIGSIIDVAILTKNLQKGVKDYMEKLEASEEESSDGEDSSSNW